MLRFRRRRWPLARFLAEGRFLCKHVTAKKMARGITNLRVAIARFGYRKMIFIKADWIVAYAGMSGSRVDDRQDSPYRT